MGLNKSMQNSVIVLFSWARKCKWEIKKTKPTSFIQLHNKTSKKNYHNHKMKQHVA